LVIFISMSKIRQFDKIFGVTYEAEELERMFINKVESLFYSDIEKGLYAANYNTLAWQVCIRWGLNAAEYRNVYSKDFAPLRYFTNSDFLKTLKLVVTLYDVYEPAFQGYNLKDAFDSTIPDFIASSPSALGIQWHKGMFYKTEMPEITDALVNENLDWLSDFPAAKKDMELALKNYSSGVNDGILDNIYKAVENVVQKITGLNTALHNKEIKTELFRKLNVANSWKAFLDHFITYTNDVARHGKNEARHEVSNEEIEACFFLALTVLRLISRQIK
jgi:hypothetical protein